MMTCPLPSILLIFALVVVAVLADDASKASASDRGSLRRRSSRNVRQLNIEVGEGRRHAIAQALPTRTHDPALDEPSFDLSSSIDQKTPTTDDHHREAASSSTELIIENGCDDNVYFALWYERSPNVYQEGWFRFDKGDSLSFGGVTSPIIHIYGQIPGKIEWEDETSGHCIYGYYCGLQIDFGSTEPDVNTVTLQCPELFYTPSPTRPPTPQPVVQMTSPPTPPPVSSNPGALDTQWVVAHNTRRRTHHTSHGKSYVPLVWSDTVASSAQDYAQLLLDGFDGCHIEHGYQGNKLGGENLYLTWAESSSIASGSWVPDPPSPDTVLTGWYEDEEFTETWQQQLHRTQVIWRGTGYVGCGQAQKNYGSSGEGWCSIHVCRYISPGNCNVDSGNYLDKALDDTSACGPHTVP